VGWWVGGCGWVWVWVSLVPRCSVKSERSTGYPLFAYAQAVPLRSPYIFIVTVTFSIYFYRDMYTEIADSNTEKYSDKCTTATPCTTVVRWPSL